MSDHKRYETLLMKAVDGVISEAEREELEGHMVSCSSCREELDDFSELKATTDAMTARILAHAHIEPPRPGPATRAALSIAWLAMLSGLLLMLAFAGWAFARDPTVPDLIKIGAGLCGLGGAILLGYTLMLRFRARGGRDPYQEIDR